MKLLKNLIKYITTKTVIYNNGDVCGKYRYNKKYKKMVLKWLNDEDYIYSIPAHELEHECKKEGWDFPKHLKKGDRILFDTYNGTSIELEKI